jgi:hypothetical protein
LDEGKGNDHNNGVGDMPSPSTKEAQQILSTSDIEHKDKGKGPIGGACKKDKMHKEPLVYTLTNDDMVRIKYQV